MRAVTAAAIILAASAVPPSDASAQSPRDEVIAAITQVFDGMRAANPAMVSAVFAPDARFAVIRTRNMPPTIGAQDVSSWIGAIGESNGDWDEQIYDMEVHVDGSMASAWAPYTFYLSGEISHCGINSIELLKDAEGWKVTQISDTRRTENCPDPRGG
jgi:ketosteroid isomerase-like protein